LQFSENNSDFKNIFKEELLIKEEIKKKKEKKKKKSILNRF
jgi:hypothetical protein